MILKKCVHHCYTLYIYVSNNFHGQAQEFSYWRSWLVTLHSSVRFLGLNLLIIVDNFRCQAQEFEFLEQIFPIGAYDL